MAYTDKGLFELGYEGKPSKKFSITYISSDITNPYTYHNRLKQALQNGIDYYYQ